MPKWKNSYESGRKYNKEWEKAHTWLKCANDGQSGYCVMCKINLIPKLSNISAHEKTKKHQAKIPNTSQSSLNKFIHKTNDSEKEAEIKLSLAIACMPFIYSCK